MVFVCMIGRRGGVSFASLLFFYITKFSSLEGLCGGRKNVERESRKKGAFKV